LRISHPYGVLVELACAREPGFRTEMLRRIHALSVSFAGMPNTYLET
jgi:hypothetical protein